MFAMTSLQKAPDRFDARLRLFVYRQLLRRQESPTVSEMAKAFACGQKKILASLERLSESHAFMMQESGELWRAAPFSCIPTPFPVKIGKRSWFGNCIWDALGIPAMLGKDARIDAACGCCNLAMPIEIKSGNIHSGSGVIHIAVPARDWYKDVAFT